MITRRVSGAQDFATNACSMLAKDAKLCITHITLVGAQAM
jgi:hypothetical protein